MMRDVIKNKINLKNHQIFKKIEIKKIRNKLKTNTNLRTQLNF